MLPKPDKSRKNFDPDNPESLETKEERLAREKKRLQKKRRLIIISIILTVGLSLSFWVYHSLKNYFNQPRQSSFHLSLSLPKINFSSSENNFDKQIKKIIDSDLSVYVADNTTNSFVWSQNQSTIFQNQSLEDIQSRLDSLTPTGKSSLNINLPQGLNFREIISNKDNFDYFNQIILPDRELLILIHSTKSVNISTLVESIYWTYIQNSSN